MPTVAILRWKKQGKTLPDVVPTPAEIAKVRRWVMIESHLIIFIPLAAVLMARGIGM
jgi:putative membrane protein